MYCVLSLVLKIFSASSPTTILGDKWSTLSLSLHDCAADSHGDVLL